MTLMEQKVRQYKNDAAGLSDILPGVAITYQRFTGECFEAGELDARTKHLIGLGVALFANNEVCTFYHVQEARALGASDQQIMETVAVASAAASGHVLSQGVMRVQGALKNDVIDTEFAEEIDTPSMDIPGGIAVSPSY
jgi:AhpD family alkylhydroperoxidase